MRHFLKVGDFDPTQILVTLAQKPHLWNAHPIRTQHPGSPHAAVDDILLWFNDISDPLAVVDDCACIPFPAWTEIPAARAPALDLMRRVDGVRLGRVMITRLAPGKTIPAHADEGAPATYYERYHLALQNLPGSVMRAGDELLTMRPGDVFWFDNRQVHSVENNSADDRIVMIADIRSG